MPDQPTDGKPDSHVVLISTLSRRCGLSREAIGALPCLHRCAGGASPAGLTLPALPPRQAAAGQGFGRVDAGGVGGGGQRDGELGAGEQHVGGAL